jgi:hypothetical protein
MRILYSYRIFLTQREGVSFVRTVHNIRKKARVIVKANCQSDAITLFRYESLEFAHVSFVGIVSTGCSTPQRPSEPAGDPSGQGPWSIVC